jgi:hypothetical protein
VVHLNHRDPLLRGKLHFFTVLNRAGAFSAKNHTKLQAGKPWVMNLFQGDVNQLIRILASNISLKASVCRAEPSRVWSMGLCHGGRHVLAMLGI